MEPIDIMDYKEAIEKAAWDAGIRVIRTDGWGASGMAELPLLVIAVPSKSEVASRKKMFVEALDKYAGQVYLFNVRAMSMTETLTYHVPVMEGGEWVMKDE